MKQKTPKHQFYHQFILVERVETHTQEFFQIWQTFAFPDTVQEILKTFYSI